MEANKVIITFVKIAFSVLLILVIVYGAARGTMIAYDFGYRVFTESPMEQAPGTDVMVTIAPSSGALEIGMELKEKGLIRDENLFFLQLKLSAYSNKIVPGTYFLNTSMTAKEMMVIMAQVEEETEEETSSSSESTQTTETLESETSETQESTGE